MTSRRHGLVLIRGLLVAACVAYPAAAWAQTEPAGTITAIKVALDAGQTEPLNASSWQRGLVAGRFTDVAQHSPAAEATSAYVLYDDRAVYVAFRCAEPQPSQRISTSLADLQAGATDYVAFSVDPAGDGTRIYRFLATPNGLRYQSSSESARYNPVWSATGNQSANGYEVEMTIPLDSLRLSGAARQNWKINFWRHLASSNDDYTWAFDPQSTSLQTDSRYWRTLSGISLTRGAVRLAPSADVYALQSLGSDRTIFDPVPNQTSNVDPRLLGADLSIPITGTTALIATVNPDFSNIERDQFTIAPQEFRQVFSEYRPFFAKGAVYVAPLPFAGIAATNLQLLYTPSLGVFYDGLKLEGTQGQNQFGVLAANGAGFDTRAAGYQFTTPDRSLTVALQGVDAREDGGSDVSAGSSVTYQNATSGLFANAEELYDRNATAGPPTPGSASLFAGGIHTSRLLVAAGYESISATFDPVQGYVQNNDIAGPYANAQYTGTGIATIGLKSYTVSAFGDQFRNRAGIVGEADAGWSAAATTSKLLTIGLSQSMSELTTYASGYPVYTGAESSVFDSTALQIGFRDGTRSPIDLTYSFGPFAQACATGSTSPICTGSPSLRYVPAANHQLGLTTAIPLGSAYSLGLQYSGSVSASLAATAVDSQWLRRLSLTRSIGPFGSLSLSLREISGTGGNALPGTNLSIGYSNQFKDQSQLYIEYGSPDSIRTLNRFVLKYVRHIGKSSAL